LYTFDIFVESPKSVEIILSQQIIVRIVRLGIAEGWTLRDDGEEDDSGGEKVDFLSLVFAAEMNFGRHVR